MNAWNIPPNNPWENPRSYAPNLEDQLAAAEYYEKLARQARGKSIAWGDMLFGAACGIVFGMSATVGLAYVWSLFL